MKKSNIITFTGLCVLILAVVLFKFFWKDFSVNAGDKNTDSTTQAETTLADNGNAETQKQSNEAVKNTQQSTLEKQTVSMKDALFIGDSRTVGLMEYSGIDGPDFFCNVGMSVYNIHKKPVSVPNVGKVTLTELLSNKKYGKIYVMLGINEVGYPMQNTVSKYGELIDFIKEKQPNAYIFIQANLHVTKKRSDSDKSINNTVINELNSEIKKMADGKRKFYIDVNAVFDDENGALSADKSEDSAHLYAKYYKDWGKWIIEQTSSLIGEV